MGVVFCAWTKSKTTDKSLNPTWFICVNWARILSGSVFCGPVKFFIRLKIRPTPCERSLKLFCVFFRWHLKIPLSDCWIQKNYSRTLLTSGHLSQRSLYFVPADSPYIYSYINLSTTATATKACPQLPKQSLDKASFFSDWWKSQEWSWHLIRMAYQSTNP